MWHLTLMLEQFISQEKNHSCYFLANPMHQAGEIVISTVILQMFFTLALSEEEILSQHDL